MAYTPYYSGGWQSGEEGDTPITPAALNHYDDALENQDDTLSQMTTIQDVSSGITPVTTYVDTTGTTEIRAYRQGNIVMFHFTFRGAATFVSGQAIFNGLPGAYGNTFQFTAFNITKQVAMTFAVTASGAVAFWYSNNGTAAGDQIRGSVTYICA